MNKTLFLIIIFTTVILPQSDSLFIQQSLEPLLEDVTIDNENEFVLDMIEYLSENPVNINSATFDELMRIPFMDYYSANLIISYRKISIIASIDELRNIEGITADLIEKISPYISFSTKQISSSHNKAKDNNGLFKLYLQTRELLDLYTKKCRYSVRQI